MKKLITLITLFSLNALASQVCDAGRDCEVVRVVTRCDLDKQVLRNKIHKLEEELNKEKAQYAALYSEKQKVIEKEVVVYKDRVQVKEKHVKDDKNWTLSLVGVNQVTGVSAGVSGNTASAQATTGLGLGGLLQYRWDISNKIGITGGLGVTFPNSGPQPIGTIGISF